MSTELAWLAGLLDGEGHVGIRLVTSSGLFMTATAQMNITCQRTFDKAVSVILEQGISHVGKFAKAATATNAPVFHFDVARLADVRLLSSLMIPYAITKRPQWELINQFSALRLQQISHRLTMAEIEIARQLKVENAQSPKAKERAELWFAKLETALAKTGPRL